MPAHAVGELCGGGCGLQHPGAGQLGTVLAACLDGEASDGEPFGQEPGRQGLGEAAGGEGRGIHAFHGRVQGRGDGDVLDRAGHDGGLMAGAGGQAVESVPQGTEAGCDVFSGQRCQIFQGAQAESGEGLQQGTGVASEASEGQAGQKGVQGPGGEEVRALSRFDDDALAGGQDGSGQGVGDADLALDVGLLGDGLDEGCGEGFFSTGPPGGSPGCGQGQSGAGHDGVRQEGGHGLHDGFEGSGLAFLLGR